MSGPSASLSPIACPFHPSAAPALPQCLPNCFGAANDPDRGTAPQDLPPHQARQISLCPRAHLAPCTELTPPKKQALFNGKQKKPRQSLHRAGLAEPPGLQTAQALPKKGPRLGSLPQRKAQSGQLSDHRAKNNVVLPGSREHRHSRPQSIKVIFIHPWSPAPRPRASPGAGGGAGGSRGSLRSSLRCLLGGFCVALIKAKSCQLSSRVFCSALGSPSSRGLVARSISWRERQEEGMCVRSQKNPTPHPEGTQWGLSHPCCRSCRPQRLLVLAVAPTQTQGGKAPRAPAPSAESWVSKGPFRKENQRAKLSSHHFLAVASQTRGQLPL